MFMNYSRALYSKIKLTESVQGKRNQYLFRAVLEYPVFQHTYLLCGWFKSRCYIFQLRFFNVIE